MAVLSSYFSGKLISKIIEATTFVILMMSSGSALATIDTEATKEERIALANEDVGHAASGSISHPERMRVIASALKIRECPDSSCEVVGTIYKGDIVDVIRRRDGWAKVSETHDYWVSEYYLEAELSPSNLAVGGAKEPKKASFFEQLFGVLFGLIGIPVGWFAYGFSISELENRTTPGLDKFVARIIYALVGGFIGFFAGKIIFYLLFG